MDCQKIFTTRDFANFLKHSDSFSEICNRYGISDEELVAAIHNVYHKKRAEEVLKTLRDRDKKRRPSNIKKKNNSEATQEIINSEKTEKTDTSSTEEMPVDVPKTELEILYERKNNVLNSLAAIDKRIKELGEEDDRIIQAALRLTEEIEELNRIAKQKADEVLSIRASHGEISQKISAEEAKKPELNEELMDIEIAIEIAKLVTITVCANCTLKSEPSTVKVPAVEIDNAEIADASAYFAFYPDLEEISFKKIRVLLQLTHALEILSSNHTNIEVKFDEDMTRIAWEYLQLKH